MPYNDARQAHSIGLAKADFQEHMAAVALNLKRWRRLTLEREKAQRHRPTATDPLQPAPDRAGLGLSLPKTSAWGRQAR